MTHGLAGGSRNRGDPAEVGESRLALEALGVVTGRDHQGGGGIGAQAPDGDQFRRSFGHKPIQLLSEFGDLLRELPVAPGHLTRPRKLSQLL